MAGNKFWGGSSSSEASDSDESSDEAPQQAVAAAQPRRQMTRWAEESSSDEEQEAKRVVRSHTDKRYAQMTERIKIMRNHQKIDDFATLITDYETLLKMLEKLKNVVEQDGGPPNSFIKAIVNMESYVERLHAEHVEKKQSKGEKLPENKQRAFNTLRAKVRKGNKTFQDQIERMKEHPSEFEEEEVAASSDSDSSADSGKSGSASSSGSDSSSDSGSDSDSDSGSSDSSGSDSDSDSGSSDNADSYSSGDSDSDGEGGDDDAAREKKMLRWLITPEKQEELQKKADKRKAEAQAQASKPRRATKDEDKGDKKGHQKEDKGKEPEEYTEQELMKKVTEISQQRGRRGFDRKLYVEKLSQLMQHAVKQGPRSQLLIISEVTAATFDKTGSAFEAMRLDLWNEALAQVIKMLPLLSESYKLPKVCAADMDDGNKEEDEEDPRSHSRQQVLFVSFLEKLDDELYKALQFTQDVYGSEYQEILGNCSKFLVVLKNALKFFEETEQAAPLGTIALRLMEQLYYKPDVLNAAVYEAIQFKQEEDKADWVWPEDSKAFMAQLSRYVIATGEARLQRRASLCQAYHLALHDAFQNARDLMHLGNLQEHALESDVHTQILFNRVLAQMGLCAFRLGKVQDAHNCLMDVCMHNKARELLAQGLSFSKNMQDRTPEQERAERLRQLPYHMHINLEVLESAHLICAMLLEVPNLAMQSIDPNNKRIISKVLRKALEQYDKQVFTGPPENNKEAVVCAAKALQRGDWQSACAALEELKVWDHIDPGHLESGKKVKEMIKEKIKTEALRTYLFAYASIYDAFHLDQLVGMFDLKPKTVHSIVSKMMIREEITAFWDESSKFVLVQHVEPTPLQRLALTLADRGAQAVENNERLVDQKTGGYGFKADQQRQQGWEKGGKGGYGKGGFGKGGFGDGKGKGKGRGKTNPTSGPPRNRGWENARAGALRGNAQRGWSTGGGGRP